MARQKNNPNATNSGERSFVLVGFFIGILIPFIGFGISEFTKANLFSYTQSALSHSVVAQDHEPVWHIKTPSDVKAIYMTSWVAGTKQRREHIVDLIDETELNSVVIDVKDYSGRISFHVADKKIAKIGSPENRIPDIKDFISYLHDRGIYVIGRISVFQDPYLASARPDLAVLRKDDSVWADYKGAKWVDMCSREVWEYIALIAEESANDGFDEVNFDYIRFPSDGDMSDIVYPSCPVLEEKAASLERFFRYLSIRLEDTGVPMSADLFGMVTVNHDDLNIGQVLERAEPYFDYIAPMVYPSHYPTTYNGYGNPALYPYEVVKLGMDTASERLRAASSSPSKLRPWLQDFDLGAIYDKEKVRAQIQAVYDAGLSSWMLWSPSNRYTRDALLPD